MTDTRDKLKEGIQNGLKRGWGAFRWLMKIVIPMSFLTAVLAWTGWLVYLDFLLAPLTGFLGLPSMAALPILIGGLTGIYGGIAAMAVLPFTVAEMPLLANFLLICHNHIQEGVIQAKSGLNPVKATLFRVVAAVATVWAMTFFIETDPSASAQAGALAASTKAFHAMFTMGRLDADPVGEDLSSSSWRSSTLLDIAKSMGWVMPIGEGPVAVPARLGLSEKVGNPG